MSDPRSNEPLSTRDLAEGMARQGPEGQPATAARTGAESRPTPAQATSTPRSAAPLFPEEESQRLRSRWDAIQTGFVDEPRKAVEEADQLVAQVIKRLAETFSEERSGLERQWDRGGEVSTEDLRVTLQRYRSFFQRLLSL